MSIIKNILSKIGGTKVYYMPESNVYDLYKTIGDVDKEKVSAVYNSAKILSENISRLPLIIKKDNRTELTNHRLYWLLRFAPNNFQNAQIFISTIEYHRNIYGNAFVRIFRNKTTGYPIYFKIIHPALICGYNFIEGQLYYFIDHSRDEDTDRTDIEPVNAYDILHFKHISKDGIFGITPLEAANDEAQILGKAAKTVNSFYNKSAIAPTVLESTINSPALIEAQKEATKDLEKKYGGYLSTGSFIPLPANTKLTFVPVNFDQAKLIESKKFAKKEIYSLYNIPPYFHGEGDNQNIEEQLLEFKNFTIAPIAAIYIAELESKLLYKNELINNIHITFDNNALLDADITTKSNAAKTMINAGTMTPNQGAKFLGNEPIDSPFGDLHFIQTQNQPIEYYDKWKNDNKKPEKNITE